MIDQKYIINKFELVVNLRNVCDEIKTIDPDTDGYRRLETLLDQSDRQTLAILAEAGIRWISMLARNRLARTEFTTAQAVSRHEWGNPFVAQAITLPASECQRHAMVNLRNRCGEDRDTFCGACVIVHNARASRN